MKTIYTIAFLLISSFVIGQEKSKYSVGKLYYNLNTSKVAVKGYDLVSYFDGTPIKGTEKNELEYNGITYRFSSSKNLNEFKANPEKFMPQYGGYCAFGLGAPDGKYGFNPQLFDVEPLAYEILNDKLYLFFNSQLFNAKGLWDRENKTNMITQADSLWRITQKKYEGLMIPKRMNPKAPPETLQMAFLVGKWKCKYKQLVRGGNYREVQGIWYGDFTPDGMSIVDYWGEGMAVSGINVRTYDPYHKKWGMTWVQNNTLGNKTLIEGEMKGEKMVFQTKYWDIDPSGQYLNRITFHNITDNNFSYYIDSSNDGGKTWAEKTTIIEAERISE